MKLKKTAIILSILFIWFTSAGFTYFNGKKIIWDKEIIGISVYSEFLLPPPIAVPLWAKNSVKIQKDSFNKDAPTIAIIIDDMGVNKFWSRQAENLPAPVTLSYLPYAEDVEKYAKYAKKLGHELMLHMPMEPDASNIDAGPFALKTTNSKQDFIENIKYNLAKFDGYIGINNHMGSKMSKDENKLSLLMQELEKRGLLYLDSRTTPISLGEVVARRYNIPTSHRDIFLDHVESKEFVKNSLRKLEKRAIKNGTAIAIGHPKKITIEALQKWLLEAKNKGFNIVPVSEVIKLRIYEEKYQKQLLVSAQNQPLQ